MNQDQALRSYIANHCTEHPAARMQLVEFVRQFKASQPAKTRDSWTRGRIVAELVRAGYVIGVDQKVAWIGGLSLRGAWVEKNGSMILEPSINV
jgi:hypothetical protein